MKNLRPTIPVQEWKLAVHLEATRGVQNQAGNPAYGCECKSCKDWRNAFEEFLPNELKSQLKRVGIELEHPTDLYRFDASKEGCHLRIVYHAIGKILEGPNSWSKNEDGDVLMYKEVSDNPNISLVVLPQSQLHDHAPTHKDTSTGDLIRFDFRLLLPSQYCRFSNASDSA